MSSDSSGFSLGWLATLALMVAAVVYWRFSVALLALLVLVGLIAWAAYHFLSKSGRAASAIDDRDYAAGLRLLHQGGDAAALISALRFKIPFPSETLKARVLAAVKELLDLQEAAEDRANPHIPAGLREDIVRRTHGSLDSLWSLCQKLALVARAKVNPEAIAPRLAKVSEELAELAQNAAATRHQLAHITLGASDLQIHDATEQVGAMKWQVTEMQKLDAMLDG